MTTWPVRHKLRAIVYYRAHEGFLTDAEVHWIAEEFRVDTALIRRFRDEQGIPPWPPAVAESDVETRIGVKYGPRR